MKKVTILILCLMFLASCFNPGQIKNLKQNKDIIDCQEVIKPGNYQAVFRETKDKINKQFGYLTTGNLYTDIQKGEIELTFSTILGDEAIALYEFEQLTENSTKVTLYLPYSTILARGGLTDILNK